MSQIDERRQAMLDMIANINKVEGFDPSVFTVEFTDMNTGNKRLRLPVLIQIAWFRLLYPKGKFDVKVTPGRDCFAATARVYFDYKDPVEAYVSEATASRGVCKEMPSVSPREWAQTAALGIALRNAGFGLQFEMAGESFSANAPDEFIMDLTDGEVPGLEASVNAGGATAQPTVTVAEAPVVKAEPERELTLEEKYQLALKVEYPLPKYKGRTFGDVLYLEPNAISYIATKYTGDPAVKEAAKVICEYAASQAA